MRRTVRVLVVALVALGLGGCGDDDDEAAGGNVERYCELSDSLDESFPEDADADTAEELAEVWRSHFEEFEDEYNEIVEAAPEEIKDEAAKAIDILKRVADGDMKAFEDPDAEKISEVLDEFDSENC
jgi:hypothetical protein